MYDVYTSPSIKTRLLASYATWKSISRELNENGNVRLHIFIERSLIDQSKSSLGVDINFEDADASEIRRVSEVV